MNVRPLTQIDFYKADHRRQYPEGTEMVFSNFTPRTNRYAAQTELNDGKIVVFGIQYFNKWFLQDMWNEGFFNQPKEKVVKEYKRRLDNSLGPDAVPVDHIEELHDLGYLPLIIKSLPEGTVVSEKVPVLTIKNTNPKFSWLVNYLETVMSDMLWKPMTSATTARKYRQILEHYARETDAPIEAVDFQAHDFSFRGMGGIQDAVMSGAAHLTSFVGTDTVPAIDFLEDYYHADSDKELIGCSVPATEHSVMCMGSKDGEIETFKRLITELYPSGIVSIVSDTWDYWKVITEYLPELKEEIMNRSGGFPVDKVVIRPDSGDPVDIICGNGIELDEAPTEQELFELGELGFKYVTFDGKTYQVLPTERQTYRLVEAALGGQEAIEAHGSIELMWQTFGGTLTDKGYKLLDSHIGLIYGDSITLDRANQILARLQKKGYASTNVVFGVGSFTYEFVTRDVHGFAMKATAGRIKGVDVEIFKDPKTDGGMKKSAKGFIAVHKDGNGEYYMVDQVTEEEAENCAFVTTFHDGQTPVEFTLAGVRKNIKETL